MDGAVERPWRCASEMLVVAVEQALENAIRRALLPRAARVRAPADRHPCVGARPGAEREATARDVLAAGVEFRRGHSRGPLLRRLPAHPDRSGPAEPRHAS